MRASETAGGNRAVPRPDDMMKAAGAKHKVENAGFKAWIPRSPLCVSSLVILAAAVSVVGMLSAGCGRRAEQRAGQPRPGAHYVRPPALQKKAQAERPAKPTETSAVPKLKIIGRKVTLTWQEAGQPKLSASAQELTGNTVSGRASMKQVTAEFYQKGRLVAKLSAPLVEADEKTRIVTATGGVTVTSTVPESNIRTVRAEWIKWYSREDKIVGNGGVSARGPVVSIDAAAFTADTRLRTLKVMANPSEARAVLGRGRQ